MNKLHICTVSAGKQQYLSLLNEFADLYVSSAGPPNLWTSVAVSVWRPAADGWWWVVWASSSFCRGGTLARRSRSAKKASACLSASLSALTGRSSNIMTGHLKPVRHGPAKAPRASSFTGRGGREDEHEREGKAVGRTRGRAQRCAWDRHCEMRFDGFKCAYGEET